jgi:hypothetical protein
VSALTAALAPLSSSTVGIRTRGKGHCAPDRGVDIDVEPFRQVYEPDSPRHGVAVASWTIGFAL